MERSPLTISYARNFSRKLPRAREAAQIYNEEVQLVSGYGEDGYLLMEKSYGKEPHKKIWVTTKVTENDKNIEEGQKLLSQGIMTGFRILPLVTAVSPGVD